MSENTKQSAGQKKPLISRGFVIALGSVLLILVVFGGLCVWSAFDYVARVPKITLKQPSLEVSEGMTITPEDLATIECKGSYQSWFALENGAENAELSADKHSLYIGEGCKVVKLQICATGSEGGNPVEAEIIVSDSSSK